jgi:hypothetical protein
MLPRCNASAASLAASSDWRAQLCLFLLQLNSTPGARKQTVGLQQCVATQLAQPAISTSSAGVSKWLLGPCFSSGGVVVGLGILML